MKTDVCCIAREASPVAPSPAIGDSHCCVFGAWVESLLCGNLPLLGSVHVVGIGEVLGRSAKPWPASPLLALVQGGHQRSPHACRPTKGRGRDQGVCKASAGLRRLALAWGNVGCSEHGMAQQEMRLQMSARGAAQCRLSSSGCEGWLRLVAGRC